MKYEFIALNIPVLRLSYDADTSGLIIPPEAHVVLPPVLAITYGKDATEMKAGHATLRRIGNEILADMTLFSKMKKTEKCLVMLKKLTPAVGFKVTEAAKNIILGLEIEELFLTTSINEDLQIGPLGERVTKKVLVKDMH